MMLRFKNLVAVNKSLKCNGDVTLLQIIFYFYFQIKSWIKEFTSIWILKQEILKQALELVA